MKLALSRTFYLVLALTIVWAIAAPAQPALAVRATATASPAAAAPLFEAPSVSAQNAAVVDAGTGEILWEKAGRTPVPMASTTKIMTAILAIEKGDLTARVTSDVDGPKMAATDGSSILGITPGDWLTLDDMLYGLMLVSGNDAALAIARHIAGSDAKFVQMMNEKAATLGLKDTHFDNPHGLDSSTHYSTAIDMAMLARYAMQNPTFARIVGTTHKTISGSRTFDLYQQNAIPRTYSGGDGIKTGYTENALECLVASATRDGRRVIIAFMRSVQRNVDAVRLLDYGFATKLTGQVSQQPVPTATPAASTAPATPATPGDPGAPDWDIPNGRFYTQANGSPAGTSRLGFAVVDDGAAKFMTEFRRYGGVQGLGYPISRRFMLDGFLSQAFQRGILQWRADVDQAYLVNVFDRLHELGRDNWLQSKYQTPPPADWSADGDRTSWDEIYRAHMSLMDHYPAFKARFDATPGVPYVAHGLPMAPVKDMGNLLVLRLQRSVFQYWKVNTPWASAGEVTVALGGDIAKDAGLLPSDALAPIDATNAAAVPVVTQTPAPSSTTVPTTVVTTTATPAASATPVASATPQAANTRTVDVVLDAAHSNADVGSSAEGVAEYLVTLRVARATRNQLETAGYTVRLTRNDDRPVSAFDDADVTVRARKEQEARVAAGLPGRIYVSITANGYTEPSVGGIETYYSAEFGGADGRRLATSILDSLISDVKLANSPVVNRGVKEDVLSGKPFGRLFSLTGKTPLVVVATGFITNPADRAFMSRSDGPEILGRAIADGIIGYLTGRT